MVKRYFIGLLVITTISLFFTGCNKPAGNDIASGIDSISKKWVPDNREGICIAKLDTVRKELILRGETNLSDAKISIINFLKSRDVSFTDSLKIIPDTSIIHEPWGLVNVSVCNIRITPSQDAEMISQSIMGTPVKILKEKRGWLFVQTPDSYLGWTEGESVRTITIKDYLKWKSSTRKIYLNKAGDIYADSKESGIISDIVAGCILLPEGNGKDYQEVILPDGRQGYIPAKYCADLYEWASRSKPEAGKLVKTAFTFMGTPYLWGGTSSKGMDCSGFIKTVYYLNGMILARDVSLQFRHVNHMTPSAFPDSLEVGDLLFFGSIRNGKTRPTHVGMYIGNTEFIHCSGMVRINSLDSTRANFSRYRKNTFLGAGRIIGREPGPGIQLVSGNQWYKN